MASIGVSSVIKRAGLIGLSSLHTMSTQSSLLKRVMPKESQLDRFFPSILQISPIRRPLGSFKSHLSTSFHRSWVVSLRKNDFEFLTSSIANSSKLRTPLLMSIARIRNGSHRSSPMTSSSGLELYWSIPLRSAISNWRSRMGKFPSIGITHW